MAASAPNRRSFYRQPMYVRIDLRVSGVRMPIPATLVDVSAGGCQIHARTMVNPHVAVEFNLPRAGMPPLRLCGTLRKVTYTANDRTFRYAIEFDTLPDAGRDDLARFIHDEQRRAISLTRGHHGDDKPKPSTRLQELRAHRRIEVNLPVRCSIGQAGPSFEAVAVDVSTGGVRLISDRVLRQEWEIVLRFTPPNEILRASHARSGGTTQRPFGEIKIVARALPGVKQTRGRYMQSLLWLHPDPQMTEELHRFVEAAAVSALRR